VIRATLICISRTVAGRKYGDRRRAAAASVSSAKE